MLPWPVTLKPANRSLPSLSFPYNFPNGLDFKWPQQIMSAGYGQAADQLPATRSQASRVATGARGYVQRQMVHGRERPACRYTSDIRLFHHI